MPSGVEEPRPQVVEHRLAGDLLDDRRQHVAGGRVVDEEGARACARPAAPGRLSTTLSSDWYGNFWISSSWWPVDIVSRSRTRIALRLVLGSAGASSGKKPSTGSSTLQLAIGDRESDGRRREALAEREHHVRLVGRVGRPPALGDHLPVAHDHDAVERVELLLGLLDEREDRRGRDALCLGGTAREGESRFPGRSGDGHDGDNQRNGTDSTHGVLASLGVRLRPRACRTRRAPPMCARRCGHRQTLASRRYPRPDR